MQIVKYFIDDQLISFVVLHLPLLMCIKTPKQLSWWLLTVSHGMAHIIHPAFIGIVPKWYKFIQRKLYISTNEIQIRPGTGKHKMPRL